MMSYLAFSGDKAMFARNIQLPTLQDFPKGYFVITYRGEIIKFEEADRRGETLNVDDEHSLMEPRYINRALSYHGGRFS